jgi:hypothetical protein
MRNTCAALLTDIYIMMDGIGISTDTKETGLSKRIALIHATPVAMQPIIGSKVLTRPDSAVAKLKAVLNGQPV